MNAEDAVWAAAYAAALGATHQGTSMLKIDIYVTRRIATGEAEQAVEAFRCWKAKEEKERARETLRRQALEDET